MNSGNQDKAEGTGKKAIERLSLWHIQSDRLPAGEGLDMGKGLLSVYWWALLLAWVSAWAKHMAWALVSRLR